MNLWKTLAVCAAFATPFAAKAATLDYDEATDGDIFGLPSFILDLGLNTVVGTNSATIISADGFRFVSDDDDFNVIIPVGMQLDSISYSYNNLFPINLFSHRIDATLTDGSGSTVYAGSARVVRTPFDPIPLKSGTGLTFLSTLPISSGSYPFSLSNSTYNPGINTTSTTVSYNYSIGFEVSAAPIPPVPLPAGMPLLLGGLAILGLIRRKRAAAL